MRTLVLIAMVAAAGCLPKTEYKCTVNGDCTASGSICEPTGYCSFVDGTCASGQRYGELSGSLASQCVEQGLADAGVGSDAIDYDAPVEVDAAATCPTGYTIVGNRGYKLISAAGTWAAQQTACAADGANVYLAIPDDQNELSGLVQGSGQARLWVGIDDQATEGTYVTVRGGTVPANSALWNTGEPDDDPLVGNGPGDCVVAVDTGGGRLADDSCTRTYPAICECEL